MKSLLFLISLLGCICGLADAAAPSPSATFEQANKFYEQKQYLKALRVYEGLIQHGSISPSILFNAGNAAFKSRNIGLAIARYREAEMLSPRDPDIQANLRFARNAVENGAARPGFGDRLSHLFTLNEMAILAAIALWLWFGLLAAREWRPAWRPVLRGYTLLSGLVFASLGAWLVSTAMLAARSHPAVVVANEAAARLGPLEESQVAFTLRDGAEVQMLAARPGWVEIKDSRGRRGWVTELSVQQLPTIRKLKAG